MSDARKRLEQLRRIAGIMADRALQPVASASAETRRIEACIDEIAGHRTKLKGSVDDPSIAGSMLAQAERLRIKQAAALSELARARVRLEAARKAAAQAVGRDRALAALIEKRQKAAALKARRDQSP